MFQVVTATFLCNVDVGQGVDPSFRSICHAAWLEVVLVSQLGLVSLPRGLHGCGHGCSPSRLPRRLAAQSPNAEVSATKHITGSSLNPCGP